MDGLAQKLSVWDPSPNTVVNERIFVKCISQAMDIFLGAYTPNEDASIEETDDFLENLTSLDVSKLQFAKIN